MGWGGTFISERTLTMAVTMYRQSRLVEGGVASSALLFLILLLAPVLLFQSVSALPTFVPNCTLAGPHTESKHRYAMPLSVWLYFCL